MKKKNILSLILAFSFLLSFMGNTVFAFGITDDFGIIIEKMGKLGFTAEKITKVGDRVYQASITGFQQKTKAVNLKAKFSPFTVKALVGENGLLLIEKADLKKAGFVVNTLYLPAGIKPILGIRRGVRGHPGVKTMGKPVLP
ncbi:MAG: hypothetical protein U9N18_05645 [Campylobacterota bacterium]|nr:hypothetical protein [Campylobacterota bacterium]